MAQRMFRGSRKSRMSRVRSALHDGNPLAIDVRSLGVIQRALDSGDMALVQAAMSYGKEIESTTQTVNGVAVIPVRGILRDGADVLSRVFGASNYQMLERDFKAAVANNQVRAVLFYHDSPGGSAIGCKRVADAIFAARGTKPIVAYAQGVCGSAAYYMAAACDQIVATADTMVGSIGTILPHVEGSKMFDEMGIKYTVITNKDSPKKGHGNIYEPLSDASRATLQSFVESYGSAFIADVARYRGITPEQVAASYGQGDAMRADVAVKSSVIDAVVSNFQSAFDSIVQGLPSPAAQHAQQTPHPSSEAGQFFAAGVDLSVSAKVRSQMFALDLIESPSASSEACVAGLKAWFRGNAPKDEAAILAGLRA